MWCVTIYEQIFAKQNNQSRCSSDIAYLWERSVKDRATFIDTLGR